MKKITCDFCGKDISREDVYEEYGWYEDSYYDLCKKCEDVYNEINSEMREFRNQEREKLEQKIEEKVKKIVSKIRFKRKNEYIGYEEDEEDE